MERRERESNKIVSTKSERQANVWPPIDITQNHSVSISLIQIQNQTRKINKPVFVLCFSSKRIFSRINIAHRSLEPRDSLLSHYSWNSQLAAGEEHSDWLCLCHTRERMQSIRTHVQTHSFIFMLTVNTQKGEKSSARHMLRLFGFYILS